MFCNSRKAQVVCYIDFVKVKAGVSKSVTVIAKKESNSELTQVTCMTQNTTCPTLQQLYFFCANYIVKQKRIKVYFSQSLSILELWVFL